MAFSYNECLENIQLSKTHKRRMKKINNKTPDKQEICLRKCKYQAEKTKTSNGIRSTMKID